MSKHYFDGSPLCPVHKPCKISRVSMKENEWNTLPSHAPRKSRPRRNITTVVNTTSAVSLSRTNGIRSAGQHPSHKNITSIVGEIINGTRKEYSLAAPLYVHNVPNELTGIAQAIEDPEGFAIANPDWQVLDKSHELGVNALYNNKEKKLWINFHGNDGRPEWHDNVFKNILKNDTKAIENHPDIMKNEALLKQLVAHADKMRYETKFNGHSYGGYKARYFGAKFNKDAELLNAHIMPWNKFPKTTAKMNYHTTITDPTNFKHIFPNIKENEKHFYYPGNKETSGILDGHYIKAFDKSEKTLSNFSKYMKSVGILGTVAGGLIVGQAVSDVAVDRDPTQDVSQGLAGMTETGAVGLNIDSEYQWSDENPPLMGFDWLAYEATQPVKSAILDFTPFGRERKREDAEIAYEAQLDQWKSEGTLAENDMGLQTSGDHWEDRLANMAKPRITDMSHLVEEP